MSGSSFLSKETWNDYVLRLWMKSAERDIVAVVDVAVVDVAEEDAVVTLV